MHWPDTFQANRRLRTLNLLLQAVLVFALFGGLNYLAHNHSWRFDLTRARLFSLSAETRSYLDRLEVPIRAVVAFEREPEDPEIAQARRDVMALLREYAHATRGRTAGIVVEELDVFKQRRRAETLGVTENNTILFLAGDRRRTVFLNELYRMAGREKQAFVGERAFTSAILDVAQADKQVIYFLAGHGEMSPDSVEPDRGLSQFRDALRQRNFAVATLDLTRVREVPADASLVIGVSPRTPFLPQEQELLRRYLSQRAGRLVLCIDPAVEAGLDDLLFDWGVLVDDVLILDTSPDFLVDGGDLILRRFARHPITQLLIDNQIPIVTGFARSVRPDPGRPIDEALRVESLIATADTAWGERHYRSNQPARFDPGVDLKGNPALSIAAVSERVTAANLPFSVRGGRLVVFGSSDWLSNNRLGLLGNLTLALNTVNWLVDRDTQLNIPPRPLERFQLSLSQAELQRLRLGLLLVVPGGVAILGLIVYWSRRR